MQTEQCGALAVGCVDEETNLRLFRSAAAVAPSSNLELADRIVDKLKLEYGKAPADATQEDWLRSTCYAVRDRVMDRWVVSNAEIERSGAKRVCYLSMEFLIGRLMRDTLNNMGLYEEAGSALHRLGVDRDVLLALEPDAALGNGGLGRLAACYMESMATLGIAGFGYGIRYEHGLFRQSVVAGQQVEQPEDWLAFGMPWEIRKRDRRYPIGFNGRVDTVMGEGGVVRSIWRPSEMVTAVAHDTPIVGWRGTHVNTLRLWQSRAIDPLRLDAFNGGDHVGALAERARAESISKVLYPSDSTPAGQELRLRQEYFFVAASLQDLMRNHLSAGHAVTALPDQVAIQLNDTHPALAVAELMRLLVDDHAVSLDAAWDITRAVTSYTNHTLLPEALETWPVWLVERLLPRHMQLIYALDERIKKDVELRAAVDPTVQYGPVSLVDRHGDWRVRMGQLAFAGSHKVNGVSALHTDLMKQSVFRDLDRLYPGRIVNKTNGVTPRRWLFQANPGLTKLICEAVGDQMLDQVEDLAKFDRFADYAPWQERFAAVKLTNKQRLATVISERVNFRVDPAAMFDVQIKRIHEYKRQLLNILETIALYQAIKADPAKDWAPRVKIFAGKAAPSYHLAKQIIRLINDVAVVVNADADVGDRLKVVFLPNYNVGLAEVIIPAADLSEQISTAGMEASGTGNMKLALNGALTIGTLDGANVEILEQVGADNISIFGLTAAEVTERREKGVQPRGIIETTPRLKAVLDAMAAGVFSGGDTYRYHDIIGGLYDHDWFLVTADFASYWDAQRKLDVLWHDQARWRQIAMRNTARMSWFSADRPIKEYAKEIWGLSLGS
jgi:glycogen phosphorylase